MAEATARIFQHDIDEMIVLVTSQAYEQNYYDLAKAIGDVVPLRPVPIPVCANEAQIWEMFGTIANMIHPSDRIIFDITNGFRSLPVLALLAASFVRVVRRATVLRMIYGAFDAKDEARNETPVLDLTPFVRLLDWTTATDAFLRYGQADVLAQLASEYPMLHPIATTLQQLTNALQTSRPYEIMEQACQLEAQMHHLPQTDQSDLQPFLMLRDTLVNEYHKLAHDAPTDKTHAHEVIIKQLDAIDWYVNKGMWVQALTATREWLVSLVLLRASRDLFYLNQRAQAEKLLRDEKSQIQVHEVARLGEIQSVWRQTTQARNSVAHGGMTRVVLTAEEIRSQMEVVHGKLRGLLKDK